MSLSRKTLTVFVTNDEYLSFQVKIQNSGKLFICHPELDSFILMRSLVTLTSFLILLLQNEMCQLLGKNVLTQRTNISQTTNTWCYKIVNRQKIHSKCKLHHGLSGNKKWKFINMISDSTLQVEPTTTCQVLAKIALPFPTICLYIGKFGKLSSGHRTGKGQFSFQPQRKAMPKNVQTTTQFTHLTC